MTMDHKAFIFDAAAFEAELGKTLYGALEGGALAELERFIERNLSRRIGEAGTGGSVPDLDALSRQVAAMASLLRGEAPTASAVGEPIKALLGGLGGSAQGDERLDRILFQFERLAAAVEATEKKMRGAPVASAGAKGATAPASAPPLDLFRAILEENLKLASPGAAAGGS